MTLVQSASQKRRVVQEDVTHSHFHGFPDTTLLESGALPIADIAELAMLSTAFRVKPPSCLHWRSSLRLTAKAALAA